MDNCRLFGASAFWIGSDYPFDLHEVYLNFRRAFLVEALPQHARLSITADSRYKLWINGTFAARGPARGYPHAQSVDAFDVTRFLRRGKNVIAAQVYQPGYSHFAYVHRGTAGILAQLECDETTTLVTDTTWRVKRDASFASLVPRVSIYGSGVEDRDLNLDEAWQWLDYDDSAWATPRIVAPVNGYPWTAMQVRDLPYLMERELPMTRLETRVGATIHHEDAHSALREGWRRASPRDLAADAEGWFHIALTPNESAYWLFDLERDYTGQAWVEIENARGGEALVIDYQEKVRAGALVISDPQTYCRVRIADCFCLHAGTQIAETFSLRGGRYLLFQLKGPAEDLSARFHARGSEYPLEMTKPLVVADPQLQKIIAMCENTARACLQDGFIDSVWRESSQWTGDALTEELILASMSDDTRPLKRVIEMAAQGAYPDGVLPSVLPGEVHAYTIVDYNFMWVELLRVHHALTQDSEFLQAMWDTLVKMLERFDQDRNADGLLLSQAGRRLFLDWSPQSRKEPSAVYNLHYLFALRAAVELARAGGDSAHAAMWDARANALQPRLRATFLYDARWYDDVERTSFSQLAAALAILTNAAQADEISALLDAIIARSLDDNDAPASEQMVLASPFMHHYLFEALRAHHRDDAVIEIIKRRWGRWANAGCPTTWENWNVDFPDGSQCHAFSAHPRYHLAQIARNRNLERGKSL